MTIEEAFVELENYVDASDPDLDLVRKETFLQCFTNVACAVVLYILTSIEAAQKFVYPYI